MRARVAEDQIASPGHGGRLHVRVDLHGVSVLDPAGRRTAIRWERITTIDTGDGVVVVRSATAELALPAGAFGLAPPVLADALTRAQSITERPDVIGELLHRGR